MLQIGAKFGSKDDPLRTAKKGDNDSRSTSDDKKKDKNDDDDDEG